MSAKVVRALKLLHVELDACKACPKMVGPVVRGTPVASKILLIGQAPGPREGNFGKPFAWTAGKTLFKWMEHATGANEFVFRERVYIASVARCFPGKQFTKKGVMVGDRRPDVEEIERCARYLAREVAIQTPDLILAIGQMAIEQTLLFKGKLDGVIGTMHRAKFHGCKVDVIALPHPSGASTWHRTKPGKTLLAKALKLVAQHPTVVATFES
jgi:uracil-DNA glycosylase